MADLTQNERDELHKRRNEELVRGLVAQKTEQLYCQLIGIQYFENGQHWNEIFRRNELDREMREEWERRKERGENFTRGIWGGLGENIVKISFGTGLGILGAWLAKKLGVVSP